ncbi:MAG: hypothetical protein ACRER3_00355 [Pseudomonas fluorescens]
MKKVTIGAACALPSLSIGLLIGFGVRADKSTDWWGAWGQWVGGLGSIAAAGVALWIALASWRRADEEKRERSMVLPRQVTSDYIFKHFPSSHPRILSSGRWGVVINNDSGGSITQVRILAMSPSLPNPDWQSDVPLGSVAAKVVRPGEACFIPVWSDNADFELLEKFAQSAQITIHFVDPEGRVWERFGGEEPCERKPSPGL